MSNHLRTNLLLWLEGLVESYAFNGPMKAITGEYDCGNRKSKIENPK